MEDWQESWSLQFQCRDSNYSKVILIKIIVHHRTSLSSSWSSSISCFRALSEAPGTGRSSGGVPSLDLSSCTSPLTSPTVQRSSKSMSVPTYPSVSSSASVPSPRQPPTFARSNSFKSPLPRRASANQVAASGSSTNQNRPFTGQTPPTRDVRVRRSQSSVSGVREVRRSLESRLTSQQQPTVTINPTNNKNSTLAAVGDENLQRDLEEYFQRFGSIQRGRVKR